MEVEKTYTAGRGTTALGIIGTVLGSIGTVAAGGGLANWMGGARGNAAADMTAAALTAAALSGSGHCCSENTPVSRYELGLQEKIAEQGAHIRLLEADKYTDQKIVEVYNAINPQITAIKNELRDIAVYQATNTATISCLGGQVKDMQCLLNGLTKVVIPKTNICPEPMDRYNSWTAPTAPAAGTPAA